jgi:hypothetical protein
MLGFLFIIATFVQYYVFILQVDSFLYEIHIFVSVLAMLGFLFIMATFVQYYVFILQVDSFLYEIHIFVSVSTMLGFLFIIATFVQYYEMIFCGDFHLCYNWFSCCLRCVPKKVKGLTDKIKLSCQCFTRNFTNI